MFVKTNKAANKRNIAPDTDPTTIAAISPDVRVWSISRGTVYPSSDYAFAETDGVIGQLPDFSMELGRSLCFGDWMLHVSTLLTFMVSTEMA